MKVFRILTSVGALVLVLALGAWPLHAAMQQAPAAPAAPAAQQAPAPQQPPAADRTFEGQLGKVDTTAKMLTVTGANNRSMTFSYTDQTQTVGESNVQGLASKTGANLKITYREEGGSNRATKIEVVPDKPAAK